MKQMFLAVINKLPLFYTYFQDLTLQHRQTNGYLWDYLDISPRVLTSSVRLEILTVYTQLNNGFLELNFVTNNGKTKLFNPSETIWSAKIVLKYTANIITRPSSTFFFVNQEPVSQRKRLSILFLVSQSAKPHIKIF